MDYEIINFKLKNGINCLLINNQCFKSVTVDVMFKVGSRDEPNDYQGLTHFAEHMFFKGTKNRPLSRTISSTIDQYGGKFNASTDYDVTHYYVKIHRRHYTVALDVLSDMLFNSLFREEDIQSEKKVVIHELESYNTDPTKFIYKMFGHTIFKNTTLEHDVGGSIDVIKKATREQFLNYVSHFYQPNNVTLIVVGNFTLPENGLKGLSLAKKEITKYFNKKFNYHSDLGSERTKFPPRVLHPNFPQLQKKKRFRYHVFPNITQSHLIMGFPAYKYNSKKFDVSLILSTILGEGMSSRLFVNIREKNSLVYSIGAGVNSLADMGIFTITCASYPEVAKLKKLIKLICLELKKLKKGDLDENELTKAKEHLIGSEVMSRESNSYLAHLYGYELLYFNKISNFEKWKKRIKGVNVKDVVELAKEMFRDHKMNLCINLAEPVKLEQIYKTKYLEDQPKKTKLK
jgi:predicted Zn-dependent peptidase